MQETEEAKQQRLKNLALEFNQRGFVDASDCAEIAKKFGMGERAVKARAIAMGVFDDRPHDERRKIAKANTTDSQYGVLQPAANLFGSALQMVLWTIVVLLVVGIVGALVTGAL